jgi:hypothetical protein
MREDYPVLNVYLTIYKVKTEMRIGFCVAQKKSPTLSGGLVS